jgi:hypothetical protein
LLHRLVCRRNDEHGASVPLHELPERRFHPPLLDKWKDSP